MFNCGGPLHGFGEPTKRALDATQKPGRRSLVRDLRLSPARLWHVPEVLGPNRHARRASAALTVLAEREAKRVAYVKATKQALKRGFEVHDMSAFADVTIPPGVT